MTHKTISASKNWTLAIFLFCFYSVLKNLVLWARSEINGSAVDFVPKKTNIERPTSNYGTPSAFRFYKKKSEATSTFDVRCRSLRLPERSMFDVHLIPV